VPVARVERVDELPGERIALVAHKGEGVKSFFAAPESGVAKKDLTLLVGAEREGLADEVVAACDRVAHIPIATESLNAAMAATIALYELRMARS
jgi:RNA methyltransferase, TrmH family